MTLVGPSTSSLWLVQRLHPWTTVEFKVSEHTQKHVNEGIMVLLLFLTKTIGREKVIPLQDYYL